MSEHLIRLRGGWLCLDPDAPPDPSPASSGLRVTLPITWQEQTGSGRGVRLVRAFGRPPLDAACERLSLRLADVDGLISAQLNGREIARPVPGTATLEIALGLPLPPRNVLALDVRFGPPGTRPEPPAQPWGTIALVIGTRDPPAPTRPGAGFDQEPGPSRGGSGNDSLGVTGT